MTPVFQDKLYTQDGLGNGNCFAACLASLLDLPLWMVPPFELMYARDDDHRDRVQQWLKRMFNKRLVLTSALAENLPEFYIVAGKSPRGTGHVVIYSKGVMVHDPNPLGGGVENIRYIQYLTEANDDDD